MSFLSSHWPKKEQGYELIDGVGSGSNSRCSSPVHSESSSGSQYRNHLYAESTSRQNRAIDTIQRILRKKTTLFLLALILTITIMQPFLNIIFQPPAYVVINPAEYRSTLESALQDPLAFENASIRDLLQQSIHAIAPGSSAAASSPDSSQMIPNTIFSSDKQAPSSDWTSMWKAMGFSPSFFDDTQADAWVESHYKGTKVYAAWRKLPRTILRADMLRYLLLLLEGGTWSDMDTVPVRNIVNWTAHTTTSRIKPAKVSTSDITSTFEDGSTSTRQPIRAVVGIECTPDWGSLRGLLEMINLKPMNRHRSLQFVQWTIHFAPHHPVMLDVIRRILQTTVLYEAYQVEQNRETNRMGWQWHQKKDQAMTAATKSRDEKKRATTAPWESISPQWIWTQGHWRLGWHPTSVEEWTGPAVFTDAVVSYIYATTNIRPEQIALIKESTQIGDILFLPEYGFAPPRWSSNNPYKESRVVHLFRGSWKKKIASGRSSR